MLIESTNSGTSVFNQNAKIQVADAPQTDAAAAAQQETLEKQQHSLTQVLNGEADTVEISDEARSLSAAARELAEREAATKEQAEAGVTVKSPLPTSSTSTSWNAAANGAKVSTTADAIYGKDERKATGEYYGEVLKNLRSEYSEDEAMRRFDEFMQSEGYELMPADGSGVLRNGIPGQVNSPRAMLSGWSANLTDLANDLGFYGKGSNPDDRLRLHSSLHVADVDGQAQFYAESTAAYYAYNSDEVLELMNGWGDRRTEEFMGQSDFDVAAYRAAGGGGNNTAVVGVDKDLGTRMAAIMNDELAKAGFGGLSEGDRITFGLVTDENGVATGVQADYLPEKWGDSEAWFKQYENAVNRLNTRLSDEISKDPSLLDSFSAMNDSVAMVDPSALSGAFSDGDRGVSYSAGRSFTLSGGQPDTMVMSDHLLVQQSGYTYVKKTDVFDPEADSMMVGAPGQLSTTGGRTDAELGNDEAARLEQALRDKLTEAVETGGQITSDLSADEYNANKSSLMDRLRGNPDEVGMYDSRTGKRIDNIADHMAAVEEEEAEEVEEEEEAPEVAAYETSYVDESKEVRRGAVADLLANARARNDEQNVEMLDNLMNSLRDFYKEQNEK